jgi:hypothetical protein
LEATSADLERVGIFLKLAVVTASKFTIRHQISVWF